MALSSSMPEELQPTSVDMVEDDASKAIGQSALHKAALRILPIIGIGYGLAYMDRISVSFAALRMNQDLHFSATVYGLGAGLFFIGNAICEVPSNLALLRFGTKRILACIIFFWGLIATSMMLVRTPLSFYTLRFMLGAAEAGFYPGVLYYLTLWFPARMRARAVSRFYIALPLSSVVMGALAGWLLGLDGKLGISGWQWLFLVEGLPAVLFTAAILAMLPDSPKQAKWLTAAEKEWLRDQLSRDDAKAHLGHESGVLKALLSSKVWMIGLFFFFAGICNYGFGFSAPIIIENATGWNVTKVGYLIALFGLASAVAMLINGAHSDRTNERAMHCIVPCCLIAVGFTVASFASAPWLVISALALSFIAFNALMAPGLSLPMEFLAGRAAAAGIAAMNTIAIFSGFAGPYWMGLSRDATGDYRRGLQGLMISSLIAAGIMFALARSLKRRPSHVDADETEAEESHLGSY
jgi:MFS transporter, ACS family, tartrate transporter